MDRDLHWDACWNVRDLGGYEVASGGQTQWRAVVRAGNLSKLTAIGRDALLDYGIRTVIDLRDPREFAIDLDPFHVKGPWRGQVTYVNEPLISEAEWAAIRDPNVLRRGYVVTLDLSKANVGRVMSAIAAAAPGGVVVHCHAGKERTGVVAALLLALAGVPDDLIADDYIASDHCLHALYTEWAAREHDLEQRARMLRDFESKADQILDPLAHVRSLGGVDTYLHGAGVNEDEIAALRERLCDSQR